MYRDPESSWVQIGATLAVLSLIIGLYVWSAYYPEARMNEVLYVILFLLAFLYLFVAILCSISILVKLGYRLQGWGTIPEYRRQYVLEARKELAEVWLWPLHVGHIVLVLIFGQFLRGLINIFRIEP